MASTVLTHIRLELAREHGHPGGDAGRGYDLVLPLDGDGRIDPDAFSRMPGAGRVRRFAPGTADAIGRLTRRGRGWAIDYRAGDEDDEAGYRFADEQFRTGEYVSIRTDDGATHTFRVTRAESL